MKCSSQKPGQDWEIADELARAAGRAAEAEARVRAAAIEDQR